jgi:hypothetical protein
LHASLSGKDFTLSDTNAEESTVSRRTLMKTAVGAGVAVGAVGIVGVSHASGTANQTTADQRGLSGASIAAGEHNHAGPIVVHVTDVKGGTIDVFADNFRTEIHDPDLAARIARAVH